MRLSLPVGDSSEAGEARIIQFVGRAERLSFGTGQALRPSYEEGTERYLFGNLLTTPQIP
ncbi:MAG: hypothetical protein F6J93_37220 [Oscillatoria sp. SIO1A7]|nr:hypothetical protein [Oscillatoria sp. SIO1A7]